MYSRLDRNMLHYSSISRYCLEQYGYDAFDDFELMVNEHISIYNILRMGIVESAGGAAQRHLHTCYTSFSHYYIS